MLTLDILHVDSPVKPGSLATLRAKTTPGANCTITVYYKPGERIEKRVEAKEADADGNVSWTWRVVSGPGTWKIEVAARLGDQTVTKETTFEISVE